jgi:hypothetical protein
MRRPGASSPAPPVREENSMPSFPTRLGRSALVLLLALVVGSAFAQRPRSSSGTASPRPRPAARDLRGRVQRLAGRVHGQRRLQGQLPRHDERRDRRLPRRQRPPHRPDVRGRHRHDDRPARHQARPRALRRDRRPLRPRGLPRRRARLLQPARRPHDVDAVQQLDRRHVRQQRRPPAAGLDPATTSLETWDRSAPRPSRSSTPAPPPAASPSPGPPGPSSSSSAPSTTCPLATSANGFEGLDAELRSTARCTCATSRT